MADKSKKTTRKNDKMRDFPLMVTIFARQKNEKTGFFTPYSNDLCLHFGIYIFLQFIVDKELYI